MKKRIIILCDGTWNDLEMRYITNVGRLAQILEPVGKNGTRPIPQVMYYDDGVAAHDSGIDKVINGITGGDLERNIYEAYRFLVFNYVKGDQVCLFGFSRGAYTVRSLAGMLERIGLVPRTEMKHVPGAMEAYRGNKRQQQKFRKLTNSKQIEVTVLGCWDTVGSMGIPDKVSWLPLDKIVKRKYEFLDTIVGKHVKHALHAVAIHEQRKEFSPTLMNRKGGSSADQTLKQVWFPGNHGCVGGGTWERRGLSNRCFRWMLDECAALGVRLGVDISRLTDHAIEDASIYFENDVRFPYGKRARKLRAKAHEIDESAVRRYLELPETRKGALKRVLHPVAQQLAPEDLKTVPGKNIHLDIGQSVWARVYSAKKANDTRILVELNEAYEFTIGRAQVWKDGDLDPCDILGWCIRKSYPGGTKQPWENGRPADINFIASRLIKASRNKRLVASADWFELVVSLDGKTFHSLGLKRPASDAEDFVTNKRITQNGKLYLSANDMAQGIINKFDNNHGWVWVQVKRSA